MNGYKILSLEAKDIVSAMALVNRTDVGYNIRDNENNINLRKFENTLDWSLDTIKLKDAYEHETRRRTFFFVAGGKRYTQAVINVKFSFSYKEFNKAGKSTFIKAGYSFKDCDIQDGAYVKDNQLIAIQTNVEIKNPLPQELLGKYFAYADGCYYQVGLIHNSLFFGFSHYIIFQAKNLLTVYVIVQSVRQLQIIFIKDNNCDFFMVFFEIINF